MNQWLESAKTVVLNLLILISFVLTSALWNNQPQFQVIEPSAYVKSKPVPTRKMEELVTPESIMFHYGNDRHTKTYTNNGNFYYRQISEEMKKWYFTNPVSYPLTEEMWEELMHKRQGLELMFHSEVPMTVISQLFMINGDINDQMKGIDRLWLYYDEEENVVYALFISTNDKQVFRAGTAISPKDLLEYYLPLGNRLPEQIMKATRTTTDSEYPRLKRPFWEIYYLPKEPQKITKYLYNYLLVTEDELIDAYFLDPSLVRRIDERDRTVIFTDGSRSIQFQQDQQFITYTDPAFQQGRQDLSSDEKIRDAIAFINKHLGWTDDYRFDRIRESEEGGEVITFRQYLGPYPLVSVNGQHLDTITVMSEDGQIVTINRSLIDLDKYISNQEWVVMSGPELFEYLRNNRIVDTSQIKNAYLAYQAQVHQGYVELTPAWVVEVRNQPDIVVTARSAQEGGKGNGLE
ncbi:transcriptional regulator [Brevibacillus sp. SYP-B805]|uniref:YycH family regulatory protein n=1 Tax=Brevibacillus sp. SYP-B805 TaxID=1578199 RepID=UPI0013EBD511|nr:two-component system activity regulator YycH [Brevibacillus sp. SYP-B805]NGQ96107.1 transcriptional regulator [Brevibacillus sp. SYP-B805]